MTRTLQGTLIGAVAGLLGGCASQPPMPAVKHVDLDRFMGDWYVIASIPTPFETDIYNAVESYRLIGQGKVQTTFRYLKGGFDGDPGEMNPIGFVKNDGSNAYWGMQFIWPIRADYRIVFLAPDYSQTIIGRKKRDYVWIMARTPTLSNQDYASLVTTVEQLGYDIRHLKKVPQRWESKP